MPTTGIFVLGSPPPATEDPTATPTSAVPDSPQSPKGQQAAPQTPMMAQYHEAKAAHPDCLVFFRMGDFFELFFDDAVKAAAALDIALTERGGAKMAGVPERSHEAYMARLIRLGFKVAICDQVETPEDARKRGGKPLLRRDVVRVVTPGTLTEDGLLETRASNYLAALAAVGGGEAPALGLAYADITTGELVMEPVETGDLATLLARLHPGELLVPERTGDR